WSPMIWCSGSSFSRRAAPTRPTVMYPAHSHAGITESRVGLSGATSENDVGVYAPGSLIFNPPGHEHRITTGMSEPSLLTYTWIGEPDTLQQPMMRFQRRERR
ncbi:MAG: dimethylsulfonioproprionate lyase family protein, partial [Kiloniellales bacterium]|nr:dimethylsulfonioproprionate lyase family protein [Kiloniellales bacterium]